MISFRGGSANRFIGGKIVHAEQFFIHPQYDAPTYNFDVNKMIFLTCLKVISYNLQVAVVRTIENLSGDNMHPIRLIGFNTLLPAGLIG